MTEGDTRFSSAWAIIVVATIPSERASSLIAPVINFLRCRTPDAWLEAAAEEIPLLLLDHASLELRAAQQAQKLIRRYGTASVTSASAGGTNLQLLNKLSRLAREELRHFEQVLDILDQRGIFYRPVSASRYAAALHAHIRRREPGRLVDTLIVGAIIEARSCERFFCLASMLCSRDPELAQFYESLLKAEARHFKDYLGLGAALVEASISERAELLLERERELILGPDHEIRFHSGIPG